MINVFSEIGPLKKVLLHEPGEELNNLTPKYLGELLFDDIPWLPLAKKEHQAFAKAFRDNGVEVYYLVDLVVDVIKDQKVKEELINQFITDSSIRSTTLTSLIYDFLMSIEDPKDLVLKMISGVKKDDLPKVKHMTLSDYIQIDTPFITNPMPNLYFTRDPFASLGNGALINHMYSVTRRRETIFADFIFKYHPEFKDTPRYYDRFNRYNIEGGDVLVLNKETIIIGVSQRTSSLAIEDLAKRLFFFNEVSFKHILAFAIPNERTFMHLDTIMTQVDYDKFLIHKGCYDALDIYEVKKSEHRPGKLHTTKLKGKLEDVLERYLNKKVKLIFCGGSDSITSDREQWSDGSNCVALAPGVVIAYERNENTNKLLEDEGIKVIRIPSSELSRGRGGPRCMSMPLERD